MFQPRAAVCATGSMRLVPALRGQFARHVLSAFPPRGNTDVFVFADEDTDTWKASLLHPVEAMAPEPEDVKTSFRLLAAERCWSMLEAHETKGSFRYDWVAHVGVTEVTFLEPLPRAWRGGGGSRAARRAVWVGYRRDACTACPDDIAHFAAGPRRLMEVVMTQHRHVTRGNVGVDDGDGDGDGGSTGVRENNEGGGRAEATTRRVSEETREDGGSGDFLDPAYLASRGISVESGTLVRRRDIAVGSLSRSAPNALPAVPDAGWERMSSACLKCGKSEAVNVQNENECWATTATATARARATARGRGDNVAEEDHVAHPGCIDATRAVASSGLA